jgi:hypothetical protein
MPDHPISSIEDTIRQFDFDGELLFQNRKFERWKIFQPNKRVEGFEFEKECLEFLDELKGLWNEIEE